MKQRYWDCYTVSDNEARKAYVKDDRQRIKVTRTITRDCATGITEETDDENEATDEEENPAEEEASEHELGDLFKGSLLEWCTGKD